MFPSENKLGLFLGAEVIRISFYNSGRYYGFIINQKKPGAVIVDGWAPLNFLNRPKTISFENLREYKELE